MKVNSINKALAKGEYSREELLAIQQSLSMAMKELDRKLVHNFKAGDEVTTIDPIYHGKPVTGTVEKIARMRVYVHTHQGQTWAIPASQVQLTQ